jgi:two-component system, OmpR family, phosphate regulon sensor histidine kinase PhoR
MPDTGHAIPKKRRLRLPITLSVFLISVNIVLMVCWIVLLAQSRSFSGLTIGTIGFAFILIGLVIYLVVTIKEVKLNQRQANFVSSVTHELKTPIAALKLNLETLELRDLDGQQRSTFYSRMHQQLERLNALINQLLEVQRLEDIAHQNPDPIEWRTFVESCASAACSKHNVEQPDVVTIRIDDSVAKSTMRRVAVEMTLVNLIDNAIKYSGDTPEVQVAVSALKHSRIEISVIDNGPGIPAHERAEIFKRFYRSGDELERKTQGTGLGLYICQTLVKSLKGSIDVADRVDQPGCVFTIELPDAGISKS